MKILAYALLFTCLVNFANAQQGIINIEQDERIPDLLKIYKSANETSKYYRIQVGFGSYAKAQNIKASVEKDFPNMYSKIDPSWAFQNKTRSRAKIYRGS